MLSERSGSQGIVMMMEAVRISESLVHFIQTIRRRYVQSYYFNVQWISQTEPFRITSCRVFQIILIHFELLINTYHHELERDSC